MNKKALPSRPRKNAIIPEDNGIYFLKIPIVPKISIDEISIIYDFIFFLLIAEHTFIYPDFSILYILPYCIPLDKKSPLNVKACFLHLPVLITEKSLALRRRTILSTQPFIYRISVSGKLSLYLHSSKCSTVGSGTHSYERM